MLQNVQESLPEDVASPAEELAEHISGCVNPLGAKDDDPIWDEWKTSFGLWKARPKRHLTRPVDHEGPGRPVPEDVKWHQGNPSGAEAWLRAKEGFVGCIFKVFHSQY